MKYKHFLRIFVLFSLGIALCYRQLLNNGFGVFNLQTFGEKDQINFSSSELMPKNVVSGKLKPKANDLGIISVRFHNGNRDSKDRLIFRVKTVGESDWHYQGQYNTDQFQPGQLFPFGFPKITDSKLKDIYFEIESLSGATGSGIYIDPKDPIFVGSSFLSKQEVLSSYQSAFTFFINKVVNILENTETRWELLSFFMPSLFYLVYLFFASYSFQFLFSFLALTVLAQITLYPTNSPLVYVSIICLWFAVARKYSFDSTVAGAISLLLLTVTPILNISSYQSLGEKTAVWSYIFFCISALSSLKISHRVSKKSFGPRQLLKQWNSVYQYPRSPGFQIISKLYKPLTQLLSVTLLYGSLSKISYSLNIYKHYYPEGFAESSYLSYLIWLISISIIFILTWFRGRKRVFTAPISILLLILGYGMVVSYLSSNFTKFQYLPKIIRISPRETSEAWVDITVSGKNFQDLPFVGKVTLGGVIQEENVIYWSDQKIVFRTNPTITKSGKICIQTVSKGKSNCANFIYNFLSQETK